MKIAVAGCGKVGSEIAQQLALEGHAVTIIDTDAARIDSIGNQYDLMGVCGSCTNLSTLEEAQVGKADLLIASTATDELNLLACIAARKLGAKHTIARVRDPAYTEGENGKPLMDLLSADLGLSMYINPEYSAATEISRVLRFPSAQHIEVFAEGRVEIVELTVSGDSPLSGVALRNLQKSFGARILVCAVRRGDSVVIPDGGFVLSEGDTISITGNPLEISRFFRALGILRKKASSVLIIGGGRIAYYLARILRAADTHVTILERDRAACDRLVELLPGVDIMHGDGTDNELLGEIGAADMDGIAVLTGSDEENIIIGLYAASLGDCKAIVKVSNGNLVRLGEKAGLSSVISPKHITANMILSYVRGMSATMESGVEAMHSICGGSAEALEFSVGRDIPGICGVPLKDLNTREQLLLACIIRDGRTIIPGGTDCIRTNDHVIVVTTEIGLDDITDILK